MPLLDPIPSPVLNTPTLPLSSGSRCWLSSPALPLRRWAATPFSTSSPPPTKPGSPPASAHRRAPPAARRAGFHPLGGLFDPTQHAAKAQIPGAALEAERAASHRPPGQRRGLLAIAAAIAPGAAGRQAARALRFRRALTGSLRPLAESIERTIQPDGSLADNASPELGRIRREQERQQRLIEESLRAALRKLSSRGRNAGRPHHHSRRPLRDSRPRELKRRISGVVHGASSSGQTVYVEPLETIEQNNELVRLIEEEQAEIHRIFMALTRQVGGYAHALVEGARVLALVDSLQARARFARDYDCVAPAITPDLLRLEAARHPLLEKRLRATGGHVVPLTLELTAAERQLIISGPNTGGKTVTLKTTALLAMMAQAGLPIPATAASFPVFTAFLADIGDAQSIEAELSTFSAHITNLDRLSRLAGDAIPGPARRARLLHRSRRRLGAGRRHRQPLS
jgi:DNA mismatch repair protein MutS2